jgi:hypothetical protein
MKTTVGVLVVLALACGVPFYVTFSPDWEDRAYDFPNDHGGGDFRVRVVESNGRACAELRQENLHTSDIPRWSTIGKDCAWPAVTGDAWLAGGQAYRINDTSSNTVATADWLFYGIVPGAAAEVRLTLSTGTTLRIATRQAGKAEQAVYAHLQPDAGIETTIIGVQLRDAADGEIRVL